MERSLRGDVAARLRGAQLQQIFVTGLRSSARVAARERHLRD